MRRPSRLEIGESGGSDPLRTSRPDGSAGPDRRKSISSTDSIPRIVPGVKIVLVATLDTELAEFLLAQSSATIPGWKTYLGKYSAGPHAGEAKAALAALYVQDGQTDLAAYQASLKSGQPNYEKLQAAKSSLEAAKAIAPSNESTDALAKAISAETNNLNSKGMDEVALYRDALAKQQRLFPPGCCGGDFPANPESGSQVT